MCVCVCYNECGLIQCNFDIQIRLDQDSSFLKTSRHYQAVVDIGAIVENPERRRCIITCAALYCILAPYDNEQQDMMLKLFKSKLLDETPTYKYVCSLFLFLASCCIVHFVIVRLVVLFE